MRSRHLLRNLSICFVACGLSSPAAHGQGFDIKSLVPTSTGPWSDLDRTTVVVPQVADGSITLDGKPGAPEYGGFVGVNVNPGENAWILDFPADRQWDGPEDSSFTFWLAHDTEFLYIGIDAKDDVVTSDDPNGAFWKDDAIEIVTDVWNDDYDNNTDSSQDAYGGHSYVNFEGRFSRWNEETGAIDGTSWSSAVDWTYGDGVDDDIWGFGEATDTGWNMEVRFRKSQFEDPDAGIELVEGAKMGFNIGMDDDDRFGIGPEGDMSRTQDLELQYFWANRERLQGWTALEADTWTEAEVANGEHIPFYDLVLDSTGRLSHGGAGEIIFGGLTAQVVPGDCDASGGLDLGDLGCLTAATRDETLAGLKLLAGDLDGAGGVDFADFLVLSSNFGQQVSAYTAGDVDLDGTVGFADFLILSANFGQSAVAAAAVPEPATGVLMFATLAISPLVRKRRTNVV